ncbi:hypothetical protein [Glycomyces harbinensis]|uniref:SPFH domain / Band 7 family protein n=1 Tax=Glycomyces harbinensis TaxID=58114 RepID=A0A1G6W048_9ACTN|nr:hypothetical protein [Glycomyces harbinensis]SDD59330.1 hypothetical protein SAMN05216270_105237 [Glycomyces harbinensis]
MSNPIIDQGHISGFPLPKRPDIESGRPVYRKTNGQYVAPDSPLTAGELLHQRVKRYYVVDVSPHGAVFTGQVRTDSEVLKFDFTARYDWQVLDPLAIVEHTVTDVPARCEDHLLGLMHEVTRQYPPNEPAAAERALVQVLGGRDFDVFAKGIRISRFRAELEAPARLKDPLHDLASIDTEAEIQRQRKKLENEIETLTQQGELGRQAQRFKEFRTLVDGGRASVLAFWLAENPTDAAQVVDVLANQANEDNRVVLETIKYTLESEHISPDQADGLADALIKRIGTKIGLTEGAEAMNLTDYLRQITSDEESAPERATE